jgi:hypothetical protein
MTSYARPSSSRSYKVSSARTTVFHLVEKIFELVRGPALADQGASGHECMRTAPILWGCSALACDAHRIHPLRVQRQGGLDAQVVHPQAEVVLVCESFEAPQLQLADQGFVCVGVEEDAALLVDTVLATPNLETVKVHVLSAERELQDLVKPRDARIASHQQAPPDQRADAAQQRS